MITFKRPDGKDCSAFYAEPKAGNRAPALVVIQEWWGLNDQIKGVANRLAAAGYRALVPDLYHLSNATDYVQGPIRLDLPRGSDGQRGIDLWAG